MGKIKTVLGDIDTEHLGVTYMHEHLHADLSHFGGNNCNRRVTDSDSLITDLLLAKEKGLNSVVDVSPFGFKRDNEILKDISRKTGLNILISTGFYREGYFPDKIYSLSKNKIADILIENIERGFDEGVFPVIIGETGCGEHELTETEIKVLKASAIAHRQTNLPLSIHCTKGQNSIDILNVLASEKARPDRIIMGHMDNCKDITTLYYLAGKGVIFGFDSIGKSHYRSDRNRVSFLKKLIDKGCHDQIVFSMDISKKSYFKEFGGKGYSYLLGGFLNQLKKSIPLQIIEKILIDNPKNIFKT